jgi:hypothetical protein
MRLPAQRDFGVLSSHLFSRAISSAPWPSFRWTMAACSVYQGAGSRPSPGGASNSGFTFHDRGGPYSRTKGAKRVVAVDVTGLPVGALVVPASTHENRASELMLDHLSGQGVTGRLELVLVDRGVTAAAAVPWAGTSGSRCAASGGTTSSRCSVPSGTPGASRSPTVASAGPDGWRSRSRTPRPQLPAGSRSRA